MKPPPQRAPTPGGPVDTEAGAASASVALHPVPAPRRRASDRAGAVPDARDDAARAPEAAGDVVLVGIARALRDRVTTILGVAQGALDGGDDRQPYRVMHQIERSAQVLLSLVDDMLDLSMAQAGVLRMDVTEFRLAEVLDDVASVVGLQADEAGAVLRFSVAPGVPANLVGDPMRLAQVLNNLGAHAVRRIGGGEVTLSVERLPHVDVPDEGADVPLRFSVVATGPAAAQAAGHESDVSLAFCERLVHAMGGALVVTRRAGGFAGHVDWQLGVGDVDEPVSGVEPGAPLDGRRLLVVDGDVATLRQAVDAARALGLDVVAVHDGWDAMREVALANQAGRPYDAALIDEVLPGMDGTMCARQLVEHAPGPAPAVLMSTAGDPDVLRAALEGERLVVREVLARPVPAERLAAALAAALVTGSRSGPARPATVGPPAGAAGPLSGTRLLLVEDNPINQELAVDLLTRAGARVTTAVDGQQALDALAAVAFDGVVMDVELPSIDGYEATREIRRQVRWRDLPIVAMTASIGPADRARALAAGMNEHVGKPVDGEALIAALVRLLQRTPRPATPPGPAVPVPEDADDPLGGLAGIDVEIGRGNTMHNDRLYRRLLLKFREAHGQTPDRIAAAWDDGDRSGARRIVHDLAGVAGTLGAMGVHGAARRIEAVCAGESAPDAFPMLLDALRDELRPVLAALESLPTT